MIGERPFAKTELHFLAGCLLLLLFGFFYQLGIYPLFLEEPRRGIIAMEMIFQNNYWVPTQTGDLYFRKPPVYNWVLIGAYKLFGTYSEFATRFFSVMSHLLLSWLTFVVVRKYLGQMMAILAAMSLLLSADILIYFSALGEIDLFYSLVTASSIFAIYYFGEKKKLWSLFVIVYILTAVGFLTKGLTSLPFTAISLLVYFIHKGDFRKLLSIQHFTGITVFLILTGGYFYQYSQYEDVSGWWTTLFSESADKATGGGMVKFLNHLLAFPLETVKNILPAGLLVPLLFRKDLKSVLKSNPFVWFCALIVVFNFPVYWLSIEAKSRYIYPLFPFLVVPLVFLAMENKKPIWSKVLRIMAIVMLSIVTVAIPGLFFIDLLDSVPNKPVLFVVLLSIVLVIWFFFLKKKVRPFLIVLSLSIMVKLTFSAIVPVTRQQDSGAAEDKQLGLEIADLTEGQALYRYGDVRMSLTIVFYVEREREAVLYQRSSYEKGFYFCYTKDLPENHSFVEHKKFAYWGEPIHLIEVF